MTLYRASDNERLDEIVYKHYGHLRFFEMVLEQNSHLEVVLKAGDMVRLDEFRDEIVIKDNSLW